MLLNDREQILALTREWKGERYENGRPKVSDEKIEIIEYPGAGRDLAAAVLPAATASSFRAGMRDAAPRTKSSTAGR